MGRRTKIISVTKESEALKKLRILSGLVSPILANIYLHYVLDLWKERAVKPNCRGVVEVVRYADDFVICIQYKNDAEKILVALRERLKKFNLELAEEKTRLVEFGRFAKQNAKSKGLKPATFNFLGFTHFIDKTRFGKFKLGRKTDRKKFKTKLVAMNTWLKSIRNVIELKEIWKILKAKLRGHYQYYGVSGNSRSINHFYFLTVKMVYKWLNRRSQRKSFSWQSFYEYIQRYKLPLPRLKEWANGDQAVSLKNFLKSLKVKPIKFHALRACFATQILANGIPAPVVMKIGGWKKTATMDIYLRLAGVDTKGATECLEFTPERIEFGDNVISLFGGKNAD